jgi:hypothetical protein
MYNFEVNSRLYALVIFIVYVICLSALPLRFEGCFMKIGFYFNKLMKYASEPCAF